MGRDVARQLAAEGLDADRFQRARIHPDRMTRDVPQGHQRAVVQDHVGIGRVLVNLVAARRSGIGPRRGQHDPARAAAAVQVRHMVRRADEAIAVLGLAVLEIDGVQHAVAVEPVVHPLGRLGRVRAVAIEAAVEVFRDLADHLQIQRGRFLRHGFIGPLEIGVQRVQRAERSGFDPAGVVGHDGCSFPVRERDRASLILVCCDHERLSRLTQVTLTASATAARPSADQRRRCRR
ncbi:hypothetical protein D3C80_1436760 [compost metagenome]